MAAQRSGQPPNERGQHGAIRPLQAGSGVGAAEHGDLVSQHEQLDVLGRGRAAQQQDQSERVLGDQVQEPVALLAPTRSAVQTLIRGRTLTCGTLKRSECRVNDRCRDTTRRCRSEQHEASDIRPG